MAPRQVLYYETNNILKTRPKQPYWQTNEICVK
jgi:hypothetical protein